LSVCASFATPTTTRGCSYPARGRRPWRLPALGRVRDLALVPVDSRAAQAGYVEGQRSDRERHHRDEEQLEGPPQPPLARLPTSPAARARRPFLNATLQPSQLVVHGSRTYRRRIRHTVPSVRRLQCYAPITAVSAVGVPGATTHRSEHTGSDNTGTAPQGGQAEKSHHAATVEQGTPAGGHATPTCSCLIRVVSPGAPTSWARPLPAWR
jgi:hypothetical protein